MTTDTETKVRVDLLLNTDLISRIQNYIKQHHGTTADALLVQSVVALLDAPPAPLNTTAFDGEAMCAANGYTDYRMFASGRNACIARIGSNHAILADLDNSGHADRWCFAHYRLARAALDAWDGAEDTEPQGWHRHPQSGRRRPDGDASKEYVNF